MRITFYRSGKLHLLLFASLSFALGVGAQGAPNAPMAVAGAAKSSVPADAKPGDYSAEPYVVEKMSNVIALQNDGTYTAETTIRVRIQSQAGVQGFGIVSAPYASGTSTMDVTYVRVTKPDGQVVVTPSENTLDMPAQITQQAPFYSDIKVKQVAVKGLAIGDTLEYQFRLTNNKPIDPGQFWYDLDFLKTGIVLDEETQFSAPQGRYVKVQSAEAQPSIEQKDGRTVYTWKTEHLKGVADDKDAADPGPHHPSIQITTFHSWDEVGAWVASLLTPQAAPTPEIRAKAQELTANANIEQDKIRALYTFVSTKYHYIGIDFGIGRYQPHAASEVLSNDYGDCKDKHTLLAALLGAIGIKAYPALVNTEEEIDPDVPSPGQFDHVITAIPQGNTYLFLDTTAEVAPYGYLIAAIRDKKAFVVDNEGHAALVQTPPNPPFDSFINFTADGALDGNGTLVSKMHLTMRGDIEVAFRIALRQIGQTQWNQAVQNISSSLGFGGTVSDASLSSIESTDGPLEITYTYTRKNFGDWEHKRILASLPMMLIPGAPDESQKNPQPINLGSPVEFRYQGTIKLPESSIPVLPEPVILNKNFADYDSTYSGGNGTLHVRRTLILKLRKVPVDEIASYREFFKSVADDYGAFISVASDAPLSNTPPKMVGASSNAAAQSLFDGALEDFRNRDMDSGLIKLRLAVVKDPAFAQAWYVLGINEARKSPDRAVDDLKKAGSVDPSNLLATEGAAGLLATLHHESDALEIWKTLESKNSDDANVHSHIVALLVAQKRYSDAIPEIQQLVRLRPQNNQILVELGDAYLRTGDKDQGIASMKKALIMDRSAAILNNVAFVYAENDVSLDDALQYSQEAVKDLEQQTKSIKLDDLGAGDFASASRLSAYWDTFGWVQYHLGHYTIAEQYVSSAWSLTQDAPTTVHLGEIYEKDGKLHEAAVAYARATAVTAAGSEGEKRLSALRAKGRPAPGESPDPLAIQNLRTFRLPRVYSQSANARFHVLLAPDGKTADAKFVSGDEQLHDKGEAALKAFKFNVPFPPESSAQILRTGYLNCEPLLAYCTFVFIPPDSTGAVIVK